MSNLFQKDTIIVVGGFSSGNHIAPLFSGLGFNCVHVCTEENKEHPLLKPTFNSGNYSENYVLVSEAEADILSGKCHVIESGRSLPVVNRASSLLIS